MKLNAGAEFDILSADEHKAQIERVKNDFIDWMRQTEGETITRSGSTFVTDATGGTAGLAKGGGGVFKVPVGYDAFVTRLSVDYEGSNAASPVTCDVRIVADQNTPSATRSINNELPSVFSESKGHAPMFRGGQDVVVCIAGGPATTTMYCSVQVLLTKRRHISSDILDG